MHWGGTVAPEEEHVGVDYSEAHPCSDEACNIQVCAASRLCKQPGNALLGCSCILGGHAMDRVDKRTEVLPSVKACSLVLVFLLFGMMLEDFARGDVAVGARVSVLQMQTSKTVLCPWFPKR